MSSVDAGRKEMGFGDWLSREIRRRGLNQTEFAIRAGVNPSTVSRWVSGRVPEAVLLERIADALVLDFDIVSTRAGVRPEGIDVIAPNSAEAVILPLVRKIDWEYDPRRLRMVERTLRMMIEEDEEVPEK